MNYLLDTCVISEFPRHHPNEKVVQWVASLEEEKLFLSAITVGEIQRGVERLPESHRKTQLRVWMNSDLVERFGARILPLDAQTLLIWGSLTARMEGSGQTPSIMDSLIVATALQNNLMIVTRNISDFLPCGVQVLNPWE